MTKTPTPTEQSKKQRDNINTPPKTLITQLLRTDLGRSVGVTAVTQLVWLNQFTSAQPSRVENFMYFTCCEEPFLKRKRRRSDPVLWQNPLYQQKIRKPKDNTQTPPKTSITQRLRTDLGRSVGVTSHPTGVVKPGLKGTNLPTHCKSCVINRTWCCINIV